MTVYPPSGGGYDTANSSLQHPLQVMPAQCLFTAIHSRMIYPIRAGATLPVLLTDERVYDFKCADPGKITPVPGDERALMREGSGGNDRIGEFHPARSAQVNGTVGNCIGQRIYFRRADEVPGQRVSLRGMLFPAEKLDLRDDRDPERRGEHIF